ncbi:hypothetical protein [Rahnella variigena]|uniref:hypothetical protein n=1 Tax=Rahnella variigena TaxID=574964 RepID=UPI00132F6FA3|nr:hypothetical protein [Rahnella variigena]
MDTKAAFEKWFDENMYLAGQCFCTESEKRRMLKAWTASRAAIEIEPPELQVIPDEESDIPDFSDWPMGFNEGVKASIKAITSHGIRIKGKTE